MRILTRIAQVLVLLAVASSFAQADDFLYFKKKAAGATDTTYCGSNSFAWCEDFNGSSACGDGSSTNCRHSWTEIVPAKVSENFSDTTLGGTNIKITSSGASSSEYPGISSDTFALTLPIYFKGTVVFDNITCTTGVGCAFAEMSDETHQFCTVGLTPTTNYITVYNGTAWSASITQVSAGTTYYLWIDHVSTSACEVRISTTNSKPVSPTKTVDPANYTPDRVKLNVRDYTGQAVNNVSWDNVSVDNNVIQ